MAVSEAACFACGVAQPYGQIRCDVCGEPLVFPKEESMRKPGQFRDLTAMEVLRSGENEAMEKLLESAVFMDGFARGADARFAAIEARLKALEEAHEALQSRAGERRLVQIEARETDLI
jgi:uncharacterized Zn finger protein (UPF0148 family)